MPTQIIPVVEPEETDTEKLEVEPKADESSEANDTPAETASVNPETKYPEEVASTPIENALASYIHTPGTPHVNAFVAALEEAREELTVASGKVQEAEAALKAKLGLN